MKLCVIAESGNCFLKLTMQWRSPSSYPAIPWGPTSLTLKIHLLGHHNSLLSINRGNQLTNSREQHHRSWAEVIGRVHLQLIYALPKTRYFFRRYIVSTQFGAVLMFNKMGEMQEFLVFPLIVYQEIQNNQQSAHFFFDNDFKRSLCEHDKEVL